MREPGTAWQRAVATSTLLVLCVAGAASGHAQRRAGGSGGDAGSAAAATPQPAGETKGAAPPPPQPAPQRPPAASPLALPLRLTGVIVDPANPQRSLCLLRCADSASGRASAYGIGDHACGVAEVREIRDDAIVVRDISTGRLERVALAPGGAAPRPLVAVVPDPEVERPAPTAPAPESGAITVKLTRAQLESYWVNLPSLLASVQATPHYQESFSGQRSLDGFTLGTTASGTLVEQLGLRAGDVVHDVNGDRLDNSAAAMRLLAVARDMTEARVRITRNGQPLTVHITVE